LSSGRRWPGISSGRNVAERHADPGNHHRPRFDAAEAIDALFHFVRLDQVVKIESPGFFRVALDGDGPGARLEVLGMARGIFFVEAEFVEIVVGGGELVGGWRLARRLRPLGEVRDRLAARGLSRFGTRGRERPDAGGGGGLEEPPSALENGAGGDFGAERIACADVFDQHGVSFRGPLFHADRRGRIT
jgi:hypothetical protein